MQKETEVYSRNGRYYRVNVNGIVEIIYAYYSYCASDDNRHEEIDKILRSIKSDGPVNESYIKGEIRKHVEKLPLWIIDTPSFDLMILELVPVGGKRKREQLDPKVAEDAAVQIVYDYYLDDWYEDGKCKIIDSVISTIGNIDRLSESDLRKEITRRIQGLHRSSMEKILDYNK